MATKYILATERSQIDPIVNAINKLDQPALERLHVWEKIAGLADEATLQQIDGSPFSVVLSGDRFEATASISVLLHYNDSADEAGGSFSDEFLATVRGRLAGEEATVESIDVDLRDDELT
ncbi:MAG: hypothetical protein A4S12_03125 [Proteobacteria bacterium SG_bin5]|nr:MAG: hypothetical protein A4S12_03125 [Proteobacteria bacterium SG_bin5]